ncbi:SAG-related sequence SRS17B [Besnoitia besnoiti]|uniref:SAG-related sequence SRS17B n=1 Tax=Besnoitia besnoiti TaxID=94643 RepID=A0A2A9MEE7_BESBE|nr:SAG-related sequence SRS17B [Besnoitia besnoiti]PFH36249.1 SAG-related sequence SRS17B [Besnoitia besnoiti]
MGVYRFLGWAAALGTVSVAAGPSRMPLSAGSSAEAGEEVVVWRFPTHLEIDADGLPQYTLPRPPLPLDDELPRVPLVPQRCEYDAEGGSPRHLHLSMEGVLSLEFECPKEVPSTLEPSDRKQAFRVSGDGTCDTDSLVDIATVLPSVWFSDLFSEYRNSGSYGLFLPVRPVDKGKKICFLCRSNPESGPTQSCYVIINVPKAELPSTRICDPSLRAEENMLGFGDDGTNNAVTLHCPTGYPVLNPSSSSEYVNTGPECLDSVKLEDLLGTGTVGTHSGSCMCRA